MNLKYGKDLAVNFGKGVTKLLIGLGLDRDPNLTTGSVPEFGVEQNAKDQERQREKESSPSPAPDIVFRPKPPGAR